MHLEVTYASPRLSLLPCEFLAVPKVIALQALRGPQISAKSQTHSRNNEKMFIKSKISQFLQSSRELKDSVMSSVSSLYQESSAQTSWATLPRVTQLECGSTWIAAEVPDQAYLPWISIKKLCDSFKHCQLPSRSYGTQICLGFFFFFVRWSEYTLTWARQKEEKNDERLPRHYSLNSNYS